MKYVTGLKKAIFHPMAMKILLSGWKTALFNPDIRKNIRYEKIIDGGNVRAYRFKSFCTTLAAAGVACIDKV